MAARWLPVWRRARQTDLIAPDEHCGVAQTLLLGVQHVLAMTGSTIIGPLLMGFDPNIAILCSGLGTIVFFCITGGRIPSYLGSSFSFIALVVTLTGYSGHGPNPDIPLACGGIFMAGLLYALIGLVVSVTGSSWIERLMPPSVTGAIGAAIGLNLAPVAARGLGHGGAGTACGIFALVCTALLAVYGSTLVRRLSILLSLVASTLVYVVVANGLHLATPVDFTTLMRAPLVGLPTCECWL